MISTPLKKLPSILLYSMVILSIQVTTTYAETKTPVEVVELFIAGYGTSRMDEAADYTTAKFRKDQPKSVWVVETWNTLNKIKYGHTKSKVIASKVAGDKAVVVVEARITTVGGDADQKEVYRLINQDGRWLVDDLLVTDEKVELEDLEI